MTCFLPEGRLIQKPENLSAMQSPAALMQACENRQILEARAILCDFAHNLTVDLGCMKGHIARDEGAVGIADGSVRDIALISRVNKPVSFIVTGFRSDENNVQTAVCSRRAAQEQAMKEYIFHLKSGDVIEARVTHLEPFGAFCDIGCGLASLIPIDMISVSRISHPSDRFTPGDDIRAVVRAVEPDGRVSLTHKELLGTWEENAAQFNPGETVSGIIRSVEDYGVFVELSPNLAGLAEPFEKAKPGLNASVFIKSIIPEKMKVKLIVIDAFEAKYSKAPLRYYFEGSHMDSFTYSPRSSDKLIETVF